MNRHLTLYEWVGGSAALTGKTPYVFWVMMDIEPHREALFNELYDHEHLPLLLKLPGSINAVRYKTTTAGVPRYLCAYEVENTTPAHVEAVERHVGHRPVEAGSAAVHLQQALHRQRADLRDVTRRQSPR